MEDSKTRAEDARRESGENSSLWIQKPMYGFSTTQAEGMVVEQTEICHCQGLNAVNMQNNSENSAVMGIPLEGPSSSDHASFVYVSHENAGIAHKGGYQNNIVNSEVVTTGNSIPLAFFQQQMMLNQQMITQQQQTMSSLITRVDSLAKAVNKSQPQSEKERAIDSPPGGRKRKAHELSDCEDITSDSDILIDSSS